MPRKTSITLLVLIIYGLLIGISLLAINSSSVPLDLSSRGMPTLARHFLFVLTGFVILIGFMIWNGRGINFFWRSADFWFIVAIFLTFITAFFGRESNEARRTIIIPIIRMSVNTFELTKFFLIIYLAKILSNKRIYEDQDAQKLFFVSLGLVVFTISLVALHNLSTAFLLLAVVYTMIWIVKLPEELMKKIHLAIGVLVILGLLVLVTKPHIIQRSSTWSDRIEKYITGNYSSTDQGLLTKVAIAKTGFFDIKPGRSDLKYIIPLSYTDYIYAIIGEEMGIVAVIIPLLYLALLFLIKRISARQRKPFNMLMVMGFGISITYQAIIHILVNIGWLPETGQPLPFISLGGTSMWVNSAMLGLILAAHKASLQDAETKKSPSQPVDTPEPQASDNEIFTNQDIPIY